MVWGSYVLVSELADTVNVSLGKLGTYRFVPAYYLYFGSA